MKIIKIKCLLLFIMSLMSVLLLTSCASTRTSKKPPYNTPSDDASIKLAEAANSVSDSMIKMARIEKTVTPPSMDNISTIPSTKSLQTRASVDWSGPIEELTSRIARAGRFQFHVLGQAPAVPVLISLDVEDQTLAEILRNIDYQAGKRASIHVYPNSRIVELRYAKMYA